MKQKLFIPIILAVTATVVMAGCTQESQNKIGRAINNWTGTNGILEVYAGGNVVRRFMKIDKLSTAIATGNSEPRPYRFGYDYLDANLNNVIDDAEKKKIYFEFSDYSTQYVFFEDPK